MIRDLLLPRTDTVVIVQAVIVALVFAGLLVWVRRRHEWRLVVIGAAMLTAGFLLLRAAH
jgi:uncharacterized BrkB/YihY/UPF0761 family membrane protein